MISQSNTGSNVDMVKLQIFDEVANKVSGFLIACSIYIRMKMRNVTVKEQIQWDLLYIQRRSVDM